MDPNGAADRVTEPLRPENTIACAGCGLLFSSTPAYDAHRQDRPGHGPTCRDPIAAGPRSTGVAFFNANGAPGQLWVFWLAPLIGAAIAGIAYPYLFGRHEALADRPVRDEALEADDDSGKHRAGPS